MFLLVHGDNSNYLKPQFQNKQQIEYAKYYMQYMIDQIIEQTKQDVGIEKGRRIHNWLVKNTQYDDSEMAQNKFNIYGVLHDQKAVCEGYARTFKYLMECVGVPCLLVSGTGTNSQGVTQDHAWNYVLINSQWYAVDVTWDDPVIIGEDGSLSDETDDDTIDRNILYRYFLKGSETFFKEHKEDGQISENSMKFEYPTIMQKDYEGDIP